MQRPRLFVLPRKTLSMGSRKTSSKEEPCRGVRRTFSRSPPKKSPNKGTCKSKSCTTSTTPVATLSEIDADWIVRKTENQVAEIVSRSPFIEKNTKLQKLPRFSHDDIELGELIAKGGFCEVRAIKSFKGEEDVLDKSAPHRRYVIKHLSHKLISKPKHLSIGAKDLVMESYCLSALDHENILSVKGYSASGVAGYSSTGRLDAFFLILPRLDKTLHKQLHDWRVVINRRRVEDGQAPIGEQRAPSEETNDDAHYPCSANSATLSTLAAEHFLFDDSNASEDSLTSSESDAESFDLEKFPFFVARIQTAVEIANALSYCHRNRILFRDLKPANIGYDFEEDRVKIFDFGLAVELPQSDDINDVFKLPGNTGTARYMAPEVIRSEPYGFKADVYSFCTLLHEIMALIKPFEKLSGKEVKEQVAVLGNRPPIDKSWPVAVRKILRRGFSDRMDVRPDMEEIQDILEDLVDL